MLRYAICDEQNKVINVILWDGISSWQLPLNNSVVRHDACNITDTYDVNNNIFIPLPEKPLPQGV